MSRAEPWPAAALARLDDVRRLLDAADAAARAGDTLTDRIATTGARQLLDEIHACQHSHEKGK